MRAETGHSMLIQVHQMVTISNLPFSDEPRQNSYDYRYLYVSLPQRDSCNNIMLPYILVILFCNMKR